MEAAHLGETSFASVTSFLPPGITAVRSEPSSATHRICLQHDALSQEQGALAALPIPIYQLAGQAGRAKRVQSSSSL